MGNTTTYLLLFVCLLYGCSSSTEIKPDQNPSQKRDVQEVKHAPTLIPSESGIVRLNLVDGKGTVEIRKKKGQEISLEFETKGYKNISAQLFTLDTLANIHFFRIIHPNGYKAGPFDRALHHKISSDGIYKLLIKENMANGNLWNGAFEVGITLTK